MATNAFYEELISSIETSQANAPSDSATFFAAEFSEGQLIEFLKFQAYYERRAAEFIASWLPDTPELDMFVMLAQQIEDEAIHYQLHMKSLSQISAFIRWTITRSSRNGRNGSISGIPSGDDTIERVAAHNVTGELGALKSFEEVYDRVPPFVQKTFDRILPDEKFHMGLGRQCIKKYCVTQEQQQRVRQPGEPYAGAPATRALGI